MKRFNVAFFIKIWIITVCIIGFLPPVKVFAWGDNYVDPDTGEKGRPSYTIEEIDNGAIGATPVSDGEDYKNNDNYPGQIIFNTISDSTIGDEKNFVAHGKRICLKTVVQRVLYQIRSGRVIISRSLMGHFLFFVFMFTITTRTVKTLLPRILALSSVFQTAPVQ